MQIVKIVKEDPGRGSVSFAHIDHNIKELKHIKKEELCFQVFTFVSLRESSKQSEWDKVFITLNSFLSTLSKEDQKELILWYHEAYKILQYDLTHIMELTDVTGRIDQMLFNTVQKIDLIKKLTDFVVDPKNGIEFPDLSNVGNRPHDKKETTFFYEEYVHLTVISMLCKLCCPIFGTAIKITKDVLDNMLKEPHVIRILKTTNTFYFGATIDKLYNFIDTVVKNNNGNKNDPTSAFNGYTRERYAHFLYAALLVKKFVNFGYYRKDSNIMRYIFSCIKATKASTANGMKKKSSVRERIDPEESQIEGESTDSRIETESKSSKVTADIPVLVKIATQRVIEKYIKDNNLDPDWFEKATEYYMYNAFPDTPINTYILSTYAGHKIGGAAGITLLRAREYCQLIVMTQHDILTRKDPSYPPYLAHMLTMTKTEAAKDMSLYSRIDASIKMTKAASFEYTNCKRMYPYKINGMSWENETDKICDYVIEHVHRYNTAPGLWELIGDGEVKNREKFEYDNLIVTNMFSYIHAILVEYGQTIQEEETDSCTNYLL